MFFYSYFTYSLLAFNNDLLPIPWPPPAPFPQSVLLVPSSSSIPLLPLPSNSSFILTAVCPPSPLNSYSPTITSFFFLKAPRASFSWFLLFLAHTSCSTFLLQLFLIPTPWQLLCMVLTARMDLVEHWGTHKHLQGVPHFPQYQLPTRFPVSFLATSIN